MSEIKIQCPRCKNIFVPDKNLISDTPSFSEEDFKKKVEEASQIKILEIKKEHQLEKEHLKKTHEIKEQRTLSQLQEAKKTVDRVSKKYEQGSNEVDGEAQEKWLEEFLEAKFPNFDVSEIKKGEKGADCLVTVKNKDKAIGKILLESKYGYPSFQNSWVTKLKNDMKDASVNYGIIVSTVLPASANEDDPYINFENNSIFALKKDKANLMSVLNLVLSYINADYLRKIDIDKRSHNLPESDKKNEEFLRNDLVKKLIEENNEITKEFLDHDKLEKTYYKHLKDNKKRIEARKTNFNNFWEKSIDLDSIPDDFLDNS